MGVPWALWGVLWALRDVMRSKRRSSSGLIWALSVVHGPFGGPVGIVGGLWAVWGVIWSEMGVI